MNNITQSQSMISCITWDSISPFENKWPSSRTRSNTFSFGSIVNVPLLKERKRARAREKKREMLSSVSLSSLAQICFRIYVGVGALMNPHENWFSHQTIYVSVRARIHSCSPSCTHARPHAHAHTHTHTHTSIGIKWT